MILAVTRLIPPSPVQPCLAWGSPPSAPCPPPSQMGSSGLVSLRGPLRCPVSSGGSPFLSTVGWGHLPCAFLCAGVMGPSCPLQVLGAPSPRGRQPSADGLWTLCSSLSVTTSSSGPRCSGICEGCWGDSEPLGDTRQV